MKNTKPYAQLARYLSITSTTAAGSGHPTSCLSAADLMCELMFGGLFRYDTANPKNPYNDRLIFSKGHAAPLFYALWAIAGAIPMDEMKTLRRLGSRLEGHPTMRFPYTETPTGSLGQGLGVGVGQALFAKQSGLDYKTYVLLGDSEMAEGSVWEAMTIATHYKLDNLIAIVDANRLGQRGETLDGHNLSVLEAKAQAFGWFTLVIDGHNSEHIAAAYQTAADVKGQPVMIIAKTFKGQGVASIADHESWHGKAVPKESLEAVLLELGVVDTALRGKIAKPEKSLSPAQTKITDAKPTYTVGDMVATREAFGATLAALATANPQVIALDAEVSNSTMAADVKKTTPKQFVEMYIAESNMVSVAVGLACRGAVPFVSSFGAFLTRASDQLRMAGVAGANIKVVGTHAGVSIGEDGGSQMALEDLAMMRSVWGSTVLYPSDATSTAALINQMASTCGPCYMRATRGKTPVIYSSETEFKIGGCYVHKSTIAKPEILIIAAGITLHETLKAQSELASRKIGATVIDLYSIKPLDVQTLLTEAKGVRKIIVVEDHYREGGIYEAVASALAGQVTAEFVSLAVTKPTQSGTPSELLAYEEIDAKAIVESCE